MTKDRIKSAFAYIKKRDPRGYLDYEQPEWVECELVDDDSPIRPFHRSLLNEILRTMRQSESQVKVQTFYPLCWFDVPE